LASYACPCCVSLAFEERNQLIPFPSTFSKRE
jgi:hypothetical protein